MGLLFVTADTQQIIDKLNRVFGPSRINRMRTPGRVSKFSFDYVQGRSLARCAKHFKLHPRAVASDDHALRWFWLLRNWATVVQTDPDSGYKTANMADLIKKWIYEGLTFKSGGDYWFHTIKFVAGSSSSGPYASVDRNGDIMTITAYTADVPSGVEDCPPYNEPPGPDTNENPPDPDDDVDTVTARRRGRSKRKAAKK